LSRSRLERRSEGCGMWCGLLWWVCMGRKSMERQQASSMDTQIPVNAVPPFETCKQKSRAQLISISLQKSEMCPEGTIRFLFNQIADIEPINTPPGRGVLHLYMTKSDAVLCAHTTLTSQNCISKLRYSPKISFKSEGPSCIFQC
jgi:hypothetical protein